ncbi:MAG TPA: hypothetical protein VG672_24740 [Bryobacteraceae bacterium]|jgi:hypothetical protein|nr:hypothetical protein [Bryobacteraceae bacterium]
MEQDCWIITLRSPRQDWEAAFEAAGAAMENKLLPPDFPANEFDRYEWQW